VAQARERCAALPNVRIEQGDIFDLLPGKWAQSADWIWEHTCYCAIPPERREDYARATHAALKPGGRLLAVFYLNPWEPGEDQNQGPPFGTTVEALDAVFAPLFELEQSWQPDVAYAGREGRELMRILRRKTQA
jgi:SAM-dependent methyltransferase